MDTTDNFTVYVAYYLNPLINKMRREEKLIIVKNKIIDIGTYNGEVDQKNLPCGTGILSYNNCDTYSGNFFNGKPEGIGVL